MKKESILIHIIKASQYSWAGLTFAFKRELAFKAEVFLFIFLIPVGFWLGENTFEKSLSVLAPLLILIIELINSAIEATVNLVVGEKRHPLAKAAKDMGSSAVLVGFILLACVWALLLV